MKTMNTDCNAVVTGVCPWVRGLIFICGYSRDMQVAELQTATQHGTLGQSSLSKIVSLFCKATVLLVDIVT